MATDILHHKLSVLLLCHVILRAMARVRDFRLGLCLLMAFEDDLGTCIDHHLQLIFENLLVDESFVHCKRSQLPHAELVELPHNLLQLRVLKELVQFFYGFFLDTAFNIIRLRCC